MNETPNSAVIFVVRFWQDRTGHARHWRGSIEHIPSGISGRIVKLDDLLRYWQQFDIDFSDNRPAVSPYISFEEAPGT